jgi:hypothetical protein
MQMHSHAVRVLQGVVSDMSTSSTFSVSKLLKGGALSLFMAGALAFGQDPQDSAPPSPPPATTDPGWHRFSQNGPQSTQPPAPVVQGDPADSGYGQQPPDQNQPPYQNQAPYQNQGPPPGQAGNQPAPPPLPPQLTIRPGTIVSIRVNQMLSSDRNQTGDAFSGTLAQPIVVDGVMVAAPGESVAGIVSEAKKAGMVSGTSRLALQLTSITMVDGNPVMLQSAVNGHNGPTSNGRDAVAVATMTGVGAAIGASVSRWGLVGQGAAIGAGAGAVIGLAGVLLTRGHPTIIAPETLVTFQLQAPIAVSTTAAPQAFRYVEPDDYQAGNQQGPPPRSQGPYGPGYGGPGYGGPGYGPGPYAPYPYYGYPGYYPYWGPGFAFWVGPRFYGGGYYRGFYGRGFYGRGFYRR